MAASGVGSAFPKVSGLEYVQGEARVEELLGKAPLCVESWATWCGPCRTSIAHLSELAAKYPEVAVVGVSAEPPSKIKPFVAKMGSQMSYTVASDSDREVEAAQAGLGMRGIPFATVIDAAGNVVYTGHPMEPAFESALAEQANTARQAAVKAARVDAVRGKSADELASCSVKELKGALAALGADYSSCIEKRELVDLLASTLAKS
ncbi:uncharacterized protein AMSG_06340 [Thecamonas trahens ATCC 50062]|uniref:Thioredoxin domain-containing protein n=1 Tax=Thecamonas trahens ATCC 50062 TaxID=461836 RepID=A0A0L0DDA2_THETB|nr:hypothetical protein AMSG_06340 [Thecamonas trahens ATCC 50062]KNC50195.1 hypothetical protein AMSG_06340 [Thecamonas trahens ATCC 50062]|eukprot:XP_013757032.1 hypothetical protein AMSG_06340 [Thecamonas trahens ATCC 50062]